MKILEPLFIEAMESLKCDSKTIEAIRKLPFPTKEIFFLSDPPLRIDFLTSVNLVEFKEAWHKRKEIMIKNLSLPVVDYHSLILMKMNTGRPKDKLDLEELQKINKYRKK